MKLSVSKSTLRRAAIYLRRSTDAQEASIEGQRTELHAYAAKHGFQIVAEFTDSGVSGTNTSMVRQGYQKLVAAALEREFTDVLVWDLSRLTRSNAMDALVELHPLKLSGVTITTLDKGTVDWDSVAGLIGAIIEANGNNEYVQKLAKGTTRGQSALAKLGGWVAGRPPIGYRVGKAKKVGETSVRKLELGKKATVDAVRWAFAEYLGGGSLRSVREGMANRGYEMTVSAVRFMLANRLYTGTYVWGRMCQATRFTYRSSCGITTDVKRGKTAEADQVVVANNHPAIVDQVTYDRVQKLFGARKKQSTPVRGGGDFVLTGLLKCECGGSLVGMRNYSSKDQTVFYRCANTRGVCDSRMIRQAVVLDAVFAALKDRFADVKTVAKIRKELEASTKAAASTVDVQSVKKAIAKEQAKLNKAQQRLVEVDADMLEMVQQQIRAIKSRVDSMNKDLVAATADVKGVLKDFDLKASEIAEMIKSLEVVYKEADPKALRAFLLETVDRINVVIGKQTISGRSRYSLSGGEIRLKSDGSLSSAW